MAAGPPPLEGIRVLEFAGLAPGPYAGMLLADAGASVLRIDRAQPSDAASPDLLARGKASAVVDIRTPRGAALVRALVARGGVDVVIDPFRPGVLERLGLGPAALRAARPALVYARLTGFRRDGRYRAMAGHDINYLAVGGALAALGRDGAPPAPPANLLADFAGGGATLVTGILLALLARRRLAAEDGLPGDQGGRGGGQVVEVAMVDGAAYLATFTRLGRKTPLGAQPPGGNLLDGGCPYYGTYATADGRHVAVGALEPRFFAALAAPLGLRAAWPEARRRDRRLWPALRRDLAAAFAARDRAHWERVFDGADACCTPVLDFDELEAGGGREGDLRPPVALSRTPMLSPARGGGGGDAGDGDGAGDGAGDDAGAGAGDDAAVREGPRPGYEPEFLAPGHGGEAVLESWLGWKKGRDYHDSGRGLVLDDGVAAKL